MISTKLKPVVSKQGELGKDINPDYASTKEYSRPIGKNEGLNDFGPGFKEHSSGDGGGDTSANFTKDTDMGLIKNYGKSGKY